MKNAPSNGATIRLRADRVNGRARTPRSCRDRRRRGGLCGRAWSLRAGASGWRCSRPSPSRGSAASGTNSGILHTGFDSEPGALETELILRSARLRDEVIDALAIPVLRCGAVMRAGEASAEVVGASGPERGTGRRGRGRRDRGTWRSSHRPGRVHARAGRRGGPPGRRAPNAIPRRRDRTLERRARSRTRRAATPCAAAWPSTVRGSKPTRSRGSPATESFEIFPRKGEFLVFDPPGGMPLERILLPVPSKRTKGVLVFPTLDGKVAAGPTAVDLEDKHDWSVRPEASDEIMPKAIAIHPPLAGPPAGRVVRGTAPGRARGELLDRALARVSRARQRRRDPLDGTDRIARDRQSMSRRSSSRWG